MIDVAIIGAGPYGLSIAAYLRDRGLEYRVFGSPMETWLKHMPKGMRLKSEGFASSLYDPGSTFTLAEYCKQEGIPYADSGLPVPLETFANYGLAFQKRFAPELEEKLVVSLRRSSGGFQIALADGETLSARRVVAAVGLCFYEYLPPILANLPEEFVTHSAKHCSVDRFKGRQVVVVGAGASAIDLAALLHQAGASVQLVARKPAIRFHDPPGSMPRTLMERIRHPQTGLGPGWKLYFCAEEPWIFRLMPDQFRLKWVRTILGPAPGWFVKDDVVGKVPFNLGVNITGAKVCKGRVSLELTNGAGDRKSLETDHVIAATGYKVDLDRLSFLDPEIQAGIRRIEKSPVLSSHFESSVPGLYFVGTTAANTFGPLMRFAFGARFAAQRVSSHLANSALHN